MPNYFDILPENYKLVKTIDAKNTKTVLLMNLVAIFIFIVSILPFIFLKDYSLKGISSTDLLIFLGVYLLLTISYVVAHELVHGLVYKVMTKQKLTFGITLTCAFCGLFTNALDSDFKYAMMKKNSVNRVILCIKCAKPISPPSGSVSWSRDY